MIVVVERESTKEPVRISIEFARQEITIPAFRKGSHRRDAENAEVAQRFDKGLCATSASLR
jgi:hypothetical protein